MPGEEDFIADGFFGLVEHARANEVVEADKAFEEERRRAAELRRQQGAGMNATELLKSLSGDNAEEKQAKLEAEIDRQNREAAEAVAAKEKENGQQALEARFPAPVITTS